MEDLEAEFYTFLEKDSEVNKHAFENNWPYILQATRNGLLISREKESIVYYTKRFQNEEHSSTVVVNALGANRKELVVNLARQEAERGIATIVKNTDVVDLSFFLSQGFQENNSQWSPFSLKDDNTFSQYVVSIEKSRNNQYKKDYRRLVRKFGKRSIETTLFVNENTNKAEEVLRLFAKYAAGKGVDDEQEIIRAHSFFFDSSIKNKIQLQHFENGEFLGWSFLTPVNDIVFYNAIICRNESNLLKYLVHQGVLWADDNIKGVQFFGTQGSENAGQDWIKARLNPDEVVLKTHLRYPA